MEIIEIYIGKFVQSSLFRHLAAFFGGIPGVYGSLWAGEF